MKFWVLVFLMAFTGLAAADGISDKKSLDVVATLDEYPITKYDLDNLIKFIYFRKKPKINEEAYEEILQYFIDILLKRKVALEEGIKIEKDEMEYAWAGLSKSLGIGLTKDEFMKASGVDAKLLDFILVANFLWVKYIETFAKEVISVSDSEFKESLEYLTNNENVSYELSEIVIYFHNQQQKSIARSIMESTYKSLLQEKDSFLLKVGAISQSSTKSSGGKLGIVGAADLNEELLLELQNVAVGEITKPICLGTDDGMCVIFKVDDRKVDFNLNSQQQMAIRQFLLNQALSKYITKTLKEYSADTLVEYKYH